MVHEKQKMDCVRETKKPTFWHQIISTGFTIFFREFNKCCNDTYFELLMLSLLVDAIIKHLEGTIEDNKVHLQGLSSEAKELLQELRLKEDTCKSLEVSQENLNKEKCALQSTNDDFVKKIFDSSEEIMNLEDILNSMKSKVVELDKHSITVSNNVDQLASYMEICNKLAQQEKDLTAKCAEVKFEQLHNQHLITRTENEALSTETELLKGRIMELQKTQEFVMVQHAEECHLAEDKVRMLETEAGKLISKKNDLEMLVTKLEEKIRNLSDSSSSSENEVVGQLAYFLGYTRALQRSYIY